MTLRAVVPRRHRRHACVDFWNVLWTCKERSTMSRHAHAPLHLTFNKRPVLDADATSEETGLLRAADITDTDFGICPVPLCGRHVLTLVSFRCDDEGSVLRR